MVVRCSDIDPLPAALCIALRDIYNYFQVNCYTIFQIRLRSLFSTRFLIHFYLINHQIFDHLTCIKTSSLKYNVGKLTCLKAGDPEL
jgi:hypothetical protein